MKSKFIGFFILIFTITISISCGEITGPKGPKAGGGRGPYILTPSKEELAKSWSDPTKVKYYTTNWLNTFTNQKIIGAVGAPNEIRYSDEKGNYHYPQSSGKKTVDFKYATNVTLKDGKNYIGAVYFNNENPSWLCWHVDEYGNLQNGYGGKTLDNPPTEEEWKKTYTSWGPSPMGKIKLE